MSLLSRIGYDWAVRCFGLDHCDNLPLRSQRTLEESAELAQALGLSREDAHKTIDAVYDRPVGDPEQEIGGVLHTVGILCESMKRDPDVLHEREVRRVLKKSPEHFAKRNQEKLDLGLDASAQSSGDLLGEDVARKAYERSIDNGSIHSNRCPTWAELSEEQRNAWRASVGADGRVIVCDLPHVCGEPGAGKCNGMGRPVGGFVGGKP